MSEQDMNPSEAVVATIGDQIKYLLADDIQAQFGSDMPPMVGAFTLIAEYTDSVTGRTNYMSMTDEGLTPWGEMGLLKGRMLIVEGEWVKGMGEGMGEE